MSAVLTPCLCGGGLQDAMLTCCSRAAAMKFACALQASLLRALDDDMAVHLLPPLQLAPGGPSAYLPPPSSGTADEPPPAAGTGAHAPAGLHAGSAAGPMQLRNQVPAPGAAARPGDANGAGAERDAGGGSRVDRAPNPALVELARLAACGRLQRAAVMCSMVADLALARLTPLLDPGAGTLWAFVLIAGATCLCLVTLLHACGICLSPPRALQFRYHLQCGCISPLRSGQA